MIECVAVRQQTRAVIAALRAIRIARGLSQRAVAAAMGTQQSAVSDIEASTSGDIQVGTLARYAHAVGARLDLAVTVDRPQQTDTAVV
jgi:transcriptional regulator with XRE-family HTH domain